MSVVILDNYQSLYAETQRKVVVIRKKNTDRTLIRVV